MTQNRDMRDDGGALLSTQQQKFRDSFVGTSLDSTVWETVQVGSGHTITVSGGNLTIASGTTASTETIIRSKDVFTIPFNADWMLSLSQRIANQEFYVEFVSVNKDTLQPDGLHGCGWFFDGATNTQAKYWVQNSGQTRLDSGLVTVMSTASSNIFTIEPTVGEAWFHVQPIDSPNGRANGYRRHQQCPDPRAWYKAQIRVKNLSSAPASSTNLVLGYLSISDYYEITAEISGSRGGNSLGQALPVAVTGTATVSVNTFPSATTMADGFANPSLTNISAEQMIFNGTTWDRLRSNSNVTTGDSGAKTATFNGATVTNFNYRGMVLYVLCGTVSGTSPTMACQLQWSPDGGTTWVNMGPASTAITATGNSVAFIVYPSNVSQAAGASIANLTTGATQTVAINAPLPRTWRVVYTIGGTTPSFAITGAYVSYIV